MPTNHCSYAQIFAMSGCLAGLCAAASAVDLTVTSMDINQAVQFGTTKLIGNNVTWVRVKVGVTGSAVAVPNVDAVLRVWVNGVELPGDPIFSINGPITAPLSPNSANINDTLNFAVLPPISNNVDFTVEVNPNHSVAETNFANNSLSVNDKNFECRKTLEVAYVPINYTFNGAGLPPANMMEPGIGDGFLRAIYHPFEWNYHKSPLPPLTWASNINNTSNTLLNTLHDIRINQIPAAGYNTPEFVFGYLPGNPYSGNGQTISIPGDVAFGNTDPARFQRTFAHEMGHAFGLQHNNLLINTIGVDTEHHLQDTQGLAQLFPTNRNDIMVAGLLTNQAFVCQSSFNTVHNDSRMQCAASDAEPATMPVLRVSGVITNTTKAVQLDPVTRIARAEPTANDPFGDLVVSAFDADGRVLAAVMVRSMTNPEMCVEPRNGRPVPNPASCLYVTLPETINNTAIGHITIKDRLSGRVLAERSRSANAPVITAPAAMSLHNAGLGQPANRLQGEIVVSWSAEDADGDALMHNLLYSPDNGESWLPLVVNTAADSFSFNASDVPGTGNGLGRFKLVTSDGLNVTESESPEYALADGNPPDTFLITPNNNDIYPQKASVIFHAASWDLEDRMLIGGQITWTSDLDGAIGTGQLFLKSDLSPGTHLITVTGTDTTGMSSFKQISITITPRIVISPDCNGNSVLDAVDISNGTSIDANGNGIPDECESTCAADIVANGAVDIDDLLTVVNAWGACPLPDNCPADIAPAGGNDVVDIDDLLTVINAWGACP